LGACFNTVVFDHELAEAARSLAKIIEAGADALIVQDVGITQFARQISPDIELHGSTQPCFNTNGLSPLLFRVPVSHV
jgi:collagenase-like PrtC family protease